jgi:hypothetical protein
MTVGSPRRPARSFRTSALVFALEHTVPGRNRGRTSRWTFCSPVGLLRGQVTRAGHTKHEMSPPPVSCQNAPLRPCQAADVEAVLPTSLPGRSLHVGPRARIGGGAWGGVARPPARAGSYLRASEAGASNPPLGLPAALALPQPIAYRDTAPAVGQDADVSAVPGGLSHRTRPRSPPGRNRAPPRSASRESGSQAPAIAFHATRHSRTEQGGRLPRLRLSGKLGAVEKFATAARAATLRPQPPCRFGGRFPARFVGRLDLRQQTSADADLLDSLACFDTLDRLRLALVARSTRAWSARVQTTASPGRSESAVALALVPAVAIDQSRSPAPGRPPAGREGRDQRARGAS